MQTAVETSTSFDTKKTVDDLQIKHAIYYFSSLVVVEKNPYSGNQLFLTLVIDKDCKARIFKGRCDEISKNGFLIVKSLPVGLYSLTGMTFEEFSQFSDREIKVAAYKKLVRLFGKFEITQPLPEEFYNRLLMSMNAEGYYSYDKKFETIEKDYREHYMKALCFNLYALVKSKLGHLE